MSQLVDLFERSPAFRELAPRSQTVYLTSFAKMVKALGDPPAGEVEQRDIIAVMDAAAKTPAAANLMLAVTRAVYTWGRRRQHVKNDPCGEIEKFALGEHQPWPDDLLHAALNAEDVKVRLATSLLYYTAQRVGDVIRLRWSDIRDGVVYLTQEKTDKEMVIPLHRDLAALLAATPKTSIRILNVTSASAVRNWLQTFAMARGFKIVPHGLRKNAVNSLLEAGCSTAETSAISGQSLQMVEHYAKRRNTAKLGSAAILQWEGNRR